MTIALYGNLKLMLILAAGVLLGLLAIAVLASAPGHAQHVGLATARFAGLMRPLGVLWH